ncbi:hypothetical protein [Flavobacterium suzhouense]|uniref:GLPGLI family protein n=1 Tax=Flavobacterium suzhouense TaxID=1529638 RepID=A0ABW5NNU6_9FLAO
MKKLLLLLLLYPVLAIAADFYPGTVTLNSGTERTGWIETPEANDQELKFRTEKDGTTEKLSIDDVKKFTVKVDDGELTFYALKPSNIKAFKKEFTTPDKKSWARMMVQGNSVSIVRLYYYTAGRQATSANSVVPSAMSEKSYIYYYWKPENDYCTYLFMNKAPTINTGSAAFKQIKYATEITFGNDCPAMAEKMDKDDFKQHGFKHLVELYEENCGSTK